MANLRQNAADFHSLQGLGRIALMKDNNPVAAEKIFRFITTKNKLPDAVYNLEWVAEQKQDTLLQKNRATEFVNKATASDYGGMYNRYLVELYTGILNDPAKALAIAEKELANRSTPQTYAWLVWALHASGNDTRALEVYKAKVSGKPLEALELYWMGKMMKAIGENYNAGEFFKAANKNFYDLSPCKQKDLSGM
jgi:tetratricopeptide (TPR) repeat protein